MSAKYQLITELYERTGIMVTRNPESWQSFLSSACRNYKCRFDEQLLIYAQRPDAIAVLELENWNKKFHRWINKDSKGIAVFDAKGQRNTLKYYFDISDTHEGYYGSKPVPIWQVNPRYEQAITEQLSDRFGGVDSFDLASVLMETEAKSLLMDGETVVGAVAEDGDGNTVNIKAEKTILATGGYGNNPEMLSEALDNVLFYGAASSTGEGINMAKEIGAKLQFMDYVKMYPQGIEVAPGQGRVATVHSMLTTQQTGAIYVNKEGKRVIDENLDFVSIKNATKEQTDKIIYLVMDQEAYDKWSVLAHGDENSSAAGRFTFEEQEKWFNTPDGTPIFRRGDNIEKVAESAGIDGASLKSTIDNWNQMVAAGNDSEFGREELYSLDTEGTVYIIEHKLRFATSLGGLNINENFEVLNTNDEVIPGLYAAGEMIGGVHGYESMPTCMLSWAVTSGRLAGETVAETLK